jgi:hypothetical protein
MVGYIPLPGDKISIPGYKKDETYTVISTIYLLHSAVLSHCFIGVKFVAMKGPDSSFVLFASGTLPRPPFPESPVWYIQEESLSSFGNSSKVTPVITNPGRDDIVLLRSPLRDYYMTLDISSCTSCKDGPGRECFECEKIEGKDHRCYSFPIPTRSALERTGRIKINFNGPIVNLFRENMSWTDAYGIYTHLGVSYYLKSDPNELEKRGRFFMSDRDFMPVTKEFLNYGRKNKNYP